MIHTNWPSFKRISTVMHEESLNILMEFLIHYGYHKVKGIPLDAIRKLARIVLEENVFMYEKKFYTQIVGGAMESAFTLTLANIFMWKWEKRLVCHQTLYIDDIFLTTNDSLQTLSEMLDKANNLHPNIKLVRQIGRSLPFLDVLVKNKCGILDTSVYHKEAVKPYIVPFNFDHPRYVFQNIIESALTRAVRNSSTMNAFKRERRSIIHMLLYIGNQDKLMLQQQQQQILPQTTKWKMTPSYNYTTRNKETADNFNAVTRLLYHHLKQGAIKKKQYDKLFPKTHTLEWAHFHGLVKVHKYGTPIRPIIAGINALGTLLSKLLYQLLAPIYLEVAKDTTFINSTQMIRKLEKYVTNGHFKSTTYFIIADVKNLYTMIPRNGALHALIRFLENFAYNNKYYKQTYGGAMGSAFTEVLEIIYMLEWEQDLIKYQEIHEEIYGRYIDDIFIVTNEPFDRMKRKLEHTADERY
ncbi:unnamed protein product [Didymodactylos carnosus]|uniref:Reverse transcriptase domain-containing protein n=1 Tax=Didymodactylos carnosus TaxID=1234261 RepID=A0A8S2F132_9BILA|nr:unnamed protein product [Didymodactylos carnosus]CAF4098639.1 unnamed protein product [Didymodactylos carnosus]